MDVFQLWLMHPYFDAATRRELAAIQGDQQEIADRFGQDLTFGTGGLRGIIGAGTNRMNRYVVRKATRGLADHIASFGAEAKARGVVIAYDSRRFSADFAEEAALTLAASGVKAFLFDKLAPTPLLSFAVRELGAIAGIVITASHNPPSYNGYKVYWQDGGQIPPDRAEAILAHIRAATDLTRVVPMARAAAETAGLLVPLGDDLLNRYLERVAGLALRRDVLARWAPACRILYTPLHGSGNLPVRGALAKLGFSQVAVVPDQEMPDGNFPTVRVPNPEEPEAFRLAVDMARSFQPDVIIATDPDADRLGVAVHDERGEYRLLTGNQLGVLLMAYVLEQRAAAGTLPPDGVVVKTIATTNMARAIAASYGVAVEDVLTGFKFIGEKIATYEAANDRTFLFGFEESYGYLAATFVRDKDAVMAAALLAEAVAWCKSRGVTLLTELAALWRRFGYFHEALRSLTLEGKEGLARIERIMAALRCETDVTWLGVPVEYVDDYLRQTSREVRSGGSQPLTLPVSDVLHYRFAGGGYLLVRPSGTEPKLKLYFSVAAGSAGAAEGMLAALQERVMRRVESL